MRKETPNFGPVWLGGDWKLRNITDYMTTAAFSLMKHASGNRQKWLTRFYAIGKEAIRPRKKGELNAIIIPETKDINSGGCEGNSSSEFVKGILNRGKVYFDEVKNLRIDGKVYENDSIVIPMNQPYGLFAKALLEKQEYPHLLDEKGNPIPPYDVTAHTLSLLAGIDIQPVYHPFSYKNQRGASRGRQKAGCIITSNTAIYRSSMPAMDEGWTRWVFTDEQRMFKEASDKNIRNRELFKDKSKLLEIKTIVFPDQSPNQILNGYAKGSRPEEYTGGIGKDGVKNLRKFVEDGGTLVFLNRASNFAIEQFELPVRDVTQGLNRKDFFIPGSILRTELDTTHRIAEGMPRESIAWFENSPAFEIKTDPLALVNNFKVIARYPTDPNSVLLSGWALGAEKIAGKAALIEFTTGKGKVILFGFRPQYRGQSLATFPLLFNAIRN